MRRILSILLIAIMLFSVGTLNSRAAASGTSTTQPSTSSSISTSSVGSTSCIPMPTFTGGVFVPDPIVVKGNEIKQGPTACPSARWTWGWVTGTVYLSRAETNKLSAGLSLAGILGTVVSVAAVAVFYGTLAVYARYIYAGGGCVKFKIYPGVPPLLVPGAYYPWQGNGDYCT